MLNRPDEIRAFTMLAISYIGEPVQAGALQSAVLSAGLFDVTDYIAAYDSLVRDGLIETSRDGKNEICVLTQKAHSILPELGGFIPESILDEALRNAWRYYESLSAGVEYQTVLCDEKDGVSTLKTGVYVNSKPLCEVTLNFETRAEALRAKTNCETRPQAVTNAVIAAITGDVNYMI